MARGGILKFHICVVLLSVAAAGCTGASNQWPEGRGLSEAPSRSYVPRHTPADTVAKRAVDAALTSLFSDLGVIPSKDVFCAVPKGAPWSTPLMGLLAIDRATDENPRPCAGRLAQVESLRTGEILFTRISTAETIILTVFWRDWQQLVASGPAGLRSRLLAMPQRDLFPMRQRLASYPWPQAPKIYVEFDEGPGPIY